MEKYIDAHALRELLIDMLENIKAKPEIRLQEMYFYLRNKNKR